MVDWVAICISYLLLLKKKEFNDLLDIYISKYSFHSDIPILPTFICSIYNITVKLIDRNWLNREFLFYSISELGRAPGAQQIYDSIFKSKFGFSRQSAFVIEKPNFDLNIES